MISVCMATYNGGKFIREQLESILSQLSPDAEIVIADDGSTDDTLQVVESLNESRIRVLSNKASWRKRSSITSVRCGRPRVKSFSLQTKMISGFREKWRRLLRR